MSEKITIAITVDEIKAAVREAVGPVCQERDALRARAAELEAAVERMAPVVVAAERYVDSGHLGLPHAVREYRAKIHGAAGHSAGHNPPAPPASDPADATSSSCAKGDSNPHGVTH